MTTGFTHLRPLLCCLALGAISCFASAPASDSSTGDPAELSLGDLARTTVTSVGRKPQRLSQAAAAVFVITRDDIRRSGAVSLPEVLRLAPGVQVARMNQNEWAISARGFNGRWANKLLVLVDGRTVYSPLYSGVRWESLNLPLEDIQRIEVIRGPGATMWGANAVNGVINIVTRAAVDTQGSSVSFTGGDADRATAYLRHGGKLGDRGFFRGGARYYDRRVGSDLPGGTTWRDGRAGVRADVRASARDKVMLTADVFRAGVHDVFRPLASRTNPRPQLTDVDYRMDSGAVLARWERAVSESSGVSVQFSYNRSQTSQIDLTEDRDILETDVQHRMAVANRHDIVWGGGLRITGDHLTQRMNVAFVPDRRRDTLVSLFVQDEIALVPDRLHVVAGSKVERNSYTRTPQVQPGVQLIWTPSQTQAVWTSIARAVRAPARSDQDMQLAIGPIALPNGAWLTPVLFGSRDFRPETVTAYETGYRIQHGLATLDVTAFTNHYDNLRSTEQGGNRVSVVAPPPVLPIYFANNVYGTSRGVEVSAGYEFNPSVRFLATYSYLSMHLKVRPNSLDDRYRMPEGEAPRHQGRWTCYWNPTRAISWDTSIYMVDRLATAKVAGYASVNSHVGWRISSKVEAGLTVDNLLDRRHREFVSTLDQTSRDSDVFGRTVRGSISWSF